MFKIKFQTDNDSFAENLPEETATILEEIAEKVRNGYEEGVVYDSNGNKIGRWSVE